MYLSSHFHNICMHILLEQATIKHDYIIMRCSWAKNLSNKGIILWEVISSNHWNMQWKAKFKSLENLYSTTYRFQLPNNGNVIITSGNYNVFHIIKITCNYFLVTITSHQKDTCFYSQKSNEAIWEQKTDSFSPF